MTGAQLKLVGWTKTRIIATLQLIALLSFRHIGWADTNPPRPEPANWRGCKFDSECILVKGVCGGIAPININFESDFKDWLNRISLVVFCNSLVAYPPWPTGIHPSCRQGQCFAIVPNSTPSSKKIEAKKKSISYRYQSLQDGTTVSPMMAHPLTEKNVNEISEINPTVEPLKSVGFDRAILFEAPKKGPGSSGTGILNKKLDGPESPSPRLRGDTTDELRIKEPDYPVYTDEHGYLHMDSRDSRYGDTPQGNQRVMPWYIFQTPVSSPSPVGGP